MIIEILKIIFEAIWSLLCEFIGCIWGLLPEIMRIKQISNYFTPVGMIAVCMGVPVVVISLALFLVKKISAYGRL